MARRIESLMLAGPAGALEAMLEEPEETPARALALVCHPHPLFGGTMHNKVVYRLARGLRRSGAAVLRFNFRGVGASQGEHDHGVGEADDARIALDWLRARFPGVPYVLAGFSFGSRIILRSRLFRRRRLPADRGWIPRCARRCRISRSVPVAQGLHTEHARRVRAAPAHAGAFRRAHRRAQAIGLD